MRFDYRTLDWKTPVNRARIEGHRRLFVCVFICMVASTIGWFARTPHAFWFLILWVGMTSGAFVGLLPGTVWQLRNPARWPVTSGRLVLVSFFAWGFMAAVGLVVIAPALHNEELSLHEFRSLVAGEILSIDTGRRLLREAKDSEAITAFVAVARGATLLYRSREGGTRAFRLTVHFRTGKSISCEGDVPERHLNDVALKCPGTLAGEVLIPEGRSWLDATRT